MRNYMLLTTTQSQRRMPVNVSDAPSLMNPIELLLWWLFGIAGALILAIGIVFITRFIIRKRHRMNHTFGTAILKIILPKEGSEQKEEGKKKNLAEVISVAEVMYAHLAWIQRPKP